MRTKFFIVAVVVAGSLSDERLIEAIAAIVA